VSRVLNLILSHQSRSEIELLLSWWSSYTSLDNFLLAYGGSREEFDTLPDIARIFVTDPRLRVNKTRDKQSYAGVWQAATRWLSERPERSFTHIYFAEFDHLPVVTNIAEHLLGRLEKEQADVLGHGLCRIDNTSNALYLYHLADPGFKKLWRQISVRSDRRVVLRMLATGSFWTRRAFADVATQVQDTPVYLELYLPTLAHHLGYRVRDFGDQNRCVSSTPKLQYSIERARELGCWTVHPIKTIP
jgi:hypothetical protein